MMVFPSDCSRQTMKRIPKVVVPLNEASVLVGRVRKYWCERFKLDGFNLQGQTEAVCRPLFLRVAIAREAQSEFCHEGRRRAEFLLPKKNAEEASTASAWYRAQLASVTRFF